MIAAVIGLLLPVAVSWLSLRALRWRQPTDSRTLTAAVAFGGGIGLSSVSTFWLMAQWGLTGAWFVAADACLWTAAGAAAWWHLRRTEPSGLRLFGDQPSPVPSPLTTADWLVRAVFALIAAVAFSTIVTEYVASPHGQWDAWAIWNQKARFLFRGGDEWNAFLGVPWSNPSHPLLVSASVARLWAYAGAELTLVPAMLSLAFGAASVAAVMAALDLRRARAWMAGAVLLAPGTFVQLAAAQTSDLPVGLFVVTTLIVLRNGDWGAAADAHGALFLAGVAGGLAAWTKNEGLLLWCIATSFVAFVAWRRGRIRPVAWWAAGAALALLTVAWLKLAVAPVPPPYLEDQTFAMLVERFLSPQRHAIVGGLAWQYWIRWGGPWASGALPLAMVAAAVAACTPGGRPVRGVVAIVALMMAGYYAMWLLSPLDTVWLITTTFDRLLLQLWPAIVLAAFSTEFGRV